MAELALNSRGPVLPWSSTEDMELMNGLLNKYSGYLNSLRKEVSEEEEKRQAAEGRAPESPPLVAAPLQVRVHQTGGNRSGLTGYRSNRSGPVPVWAGTKPVQIQNSNLNSKNS